MELFCNDKYWNKVEDHTFKILPKSLQPDSQKLQHSSVDRNNQEFLRQWGNHNFKFKFQAQGGSNNGYDQKNHINQSLFQASILNAEAEEPNNPGSKIPIKCTWIRFRGNRQEKIPEISSNVYQLCAKDIGCKIRVECEPLDSDFEGKAIGEFGPVQLDIQAKQHLEQIIGAGGSQFSVQVIMNDRVSSYELKEECEDATLYINQHILKISLKNQNPVVIQKNNQSKHQQFRNVDQINQQQIQTTLSFKYTVNYPKIELHPFDTRKFSILYNDSIESQLNNNNISVIDKFSINLQDQNSSQSDVNKSINQSLFEKVENHFEKRLDLRTLSRESRDLICTTISCFAAQSYFINSKIINSIQDYDTCNVILKNSQNPNSSFRMKNSQSDEEKNYLISDVLLELEFVKNDLNFQIQQVKIQTNEAIRYKKQFYDIEEEMKCTIASYKQLIEQFQQSDSGETAKLREEISNLQREIQNLESQRNKMIQKQQIKEDENKNLEMRIRELGQKNDQLIKKMDTVQEQIGVPKKDYDQIVISNKKKDEQINQLKEEIQDMKSFMNEKDQEMQELLKSNNVLQYNQQKKQEELINREEEVVNLRKKCKELEILIQNTKNDQVNQMQKLPLQNEQQIQEMQDKLQQLEELNESLLTQRKSLQKQKDGLMKDYQKALKDKENQDSNHQQQIQALEIEHNLLIKKYEEQIENQRKANERLQNELQDQMQILNKMESQKHILECKFNNFIQVKQSMVSQGVQVDKLHWSTQCSSQTPITIKYDKNVEANLIDENPIIQSNLNDSFQSNEKQNYIQTINNSQNQILEKEQIIKTQNQKMKQMEMLLQLNEAQTGEKESAIKQLRDVIQQKEGFIVDLQRQMSKLMERLSEAEQKLFELQDSFTDDSKSYKSRNI